MPTVEMRRFIEQRLREAAAQVDAANRPALKDRAERALASWQAQLDELDRHAPSRQTDEAAAAELPHEHD